MRALFSFMSSGVAPAVPVVSGVSYGIVDTAGGGQRVVVTVDDSTGCTGITAGAVSFTSFAIDDGTHVSGIPGAHAAGVVDVVVTNAAGPSTTGTGLIEYWTPAQITGADAYLDANKGVTDAGAGAVSAWLDPVNARNFVQATGANRPVQTAAVFGTLPSIRFTPEQWVALASVVSLTGGRSVFVVGAWTTSTAGGTHPGMTFIGDDTGDYASFGTDAGALAYQNYNAAGNATHYFTRGSALNDGVARLVGVTADTTSDEKIYVGTVQQGATNSPGVVDDVAHAYKSIGETYQHAAGFSGDMGAVVIVAGVISGGDHTKLNDWAMQRWGTP